MTLGPGARHHVLKRAHSQSAVKESDENCISPWEPDPGPLCSLSLALPRSPWGSLHPALPFSPTPLTDGSAGAGWVSLGPRPLPAASISLWLSSVSQGKFREQFKAAFSCCLPGLGPCGSLKVPSPRSSASHKSLSLKSQCSVSKVSEHVVLTSVTTVLP